MTKLIKLLVSVLGDVTPACIKLLSVGMTYEKQSKQEFAVCLLPIKIELVTPMHEMQLTAAMINWAAPSVHWHRRADEKRKKKK